MPSTTSASAPNHFVTSPAGEWNWWREVAVRGAGFPARGVLELADEKLAADADALVLGGAQLGAGEIAGFRGRYDEALLKLDRRLQAIARSPRFREAVTWQNHHVLDTALDPLLRRHPDRRRDRKHRAHEELVANYWQRYHVKNDTIGFFGPLGWGRVEPQLARISMRPGPRLIASSAVHFEAWPIDKLAERLAEDPAMGPWLPVRRVPFVRLDGTLVRVPGEPSFRIEEAEALVLRACVPGRRACDVATAVRGESLLATDSDVYAALRRLVARRLVVWKLEVPADPHPEAALRRLLERVDDDVVRRRALEPLARIEAARSEVAAARGRPEQLRSALHDLDEMFRELTRAEPSRHAGRTYAARTVIYHDSRRDLDLALGAPFIDALSPLTLVLDGARWLMCRVALAVRAALMDVYRDLRAEMEGTVDLGSFWFASLPLLLHGSEAHVQRIADEYQRRWEAILAVDYGESRVRYATTDIAATVGKAFEAPGAGWRGARYCSPDVMIAANGIDAVRAGSFELVLGELHLAINALRHACFVAQHPEPRRLLAALEADPNRARVFPVLPKESPPKLTTRLHPALGLAGDRHVSLFYQTVDPTRVEVVAASDVVVEEHQGALIGRFSDGDEFDLVDVFSEVLTGLVLDQGRIFGPDKAHTPRVNFDCVVVARETWRFRPDNLAFARVPDEAARFLALRRWWHEAGLPRQVFVKTAAEQKPFYVDFDSPIYANILSKAVRRQRDRSGDTTRTITITEMLPRLHECWLADSDGNRYTAELRMVAVDRRDVDLAAQREAAAASGEEAVLHALATEGASRS